jgi:hypothetical protein
MMVMGCASMVLMGMTIRTNQLIKNATQPNSCHRNQKNDYHNQPEDQLPSMVMTVSDKAHRNLTSKVTA